MDHLDDLPGSEHACNAHGYSCMRLARSLLASLQLNAPRRSCSGLRILQIRSIYSSDLKMDDEEMSLNNGGPSRLIRVETASNGDLVPDAPMSKSAAKKAAKKVSCSLGFVLDNPKRQASMGQSADGIRPTEKPPKPSLERTKEQSGKKRNLRLCKILELVRWTKKNEQRSNGG